MAVLKTYDPARVSLSVAGQTINGFAPGTFIRLQPQQAFVSDDFGVDGEPIRWMNEDPYSTLVVTLRQTAPSNGQLSNLLNIDLLTQAGIVPVVLEHDGSIYVTARGWVSGHAPVEYGGEATGRRWTLRLLDCIYDTQGSDSTPALSTIL